MIESMLTINREQVAVLAIYAHDCRRVVQSDTSSSSATRCLIIDSKSELGVTVLGDNRQTSIQCSDVVPIPSTFRESVILQRSMSGHESGCSILAKQTALTNLDKIKGTLIDTPVP